MPIQFVTDSSADLTPEQQQQHNIEVIDLSISWPDGQTPEPGNKAFYEKLMTVKHLPKTAAPSPEAFHAVFERAVANGDEVVAVLLSAGISSTVQSAHIARSMMTHKDKVHIVDSRLATMGLQLLLMEGIRMRDKGISAEDIAAVLETRCRNVKFYTIVPDLKYLKLGGRISSGAATIGALLHVMPIVGMVDGKVASIAKERGRVNALKRMVDIIKSDGVDERYPVMFAYTYTPDSMYELQKLCDDAGLPVQNRTHCELGFTIGTYGGPGCAGIAFFTKPKDEFINQ